MSDAAMTDESRILLGEEVAAAKLAGQPLRLG